MAKLNKYLKKATSTVIAVQLDLDTYGFTYEKWGGTQTCKAGDWIVRNGSETYTVDGKTFACTYRAISPGIYAKTTPVWAEVADQPGKIETSEGVTHYKAGAYLAYNEPNRRDGYAVEAETFEEMYELADQHTDATA